MRYFRSNTKPTLRLTVLALSMGLLVGCGGGGSSSSNPPPTDKTPSDGSNNQNNNSKATQKITGLSLPERMAIGQSADLSAVSSANLPVTYSSKTPEICSVLNAQVQTIKAGTCTIEANQIGNEKYLAAAKESVSSTVVASESYLTKTGVTRCIGILPDNSDFFYTDCTISNLARLSGLNQDGEVQAGQIMSYTELVRDGERCLKDNTTGLVWEQKTNDGSLRDASWKYSWYSQDMSTNGGKEGHIGSAETCKNTLTSCNTQAYIEQLNRDKYCGYSDWRLPAVGELVNLVDYGKSSPKIYSGFYHTVSRSYWTNASWVANKQGVMVVDFGSGAVKQGMAKDSTSPIRAVRGTQIQP